MSQHEILLDSSLEPTASESGRRELGYSAMVLSEVFPPQNGGSGKWLWEIYRRQPATNYVMAVGNSHGADPRDESFGQYVERIDLAMPFRGISNVKSVGHYLRQIRLVRSLAIRHNVKMIHAARPLSEGLIARALKLSSGIPYLCYVHGEDINIAMTSRELKLLTNSVLKNSERVIANSSFTQQLLLDDWGLSPERIVQMHPGVDTREFTPATDECERPKHWEGKTVLLTVGRLQKRKGHDMVIRAIAEIVRVIPNLHYAIVGGGEERETLERLAKELNVEDRVEFAGEINDSMLRLYHQQCDIFLLANRSIGRDVEGFGIVLLEAQACGKPVIAGASGGTIDTMLPGKSGYVLDCETPSELIETIRSSLSCASRRSQMGQIGREHVVTNFDWKSLADRANSLFASLSFNH